MCKYETETSVSVIIDLLELNYTLLLFVLCLFSAFFLFSFSHLLGDYLNIF